MNLSQQSKKFFIFSQVPNVAWIYFFQAEDEDDDADADADDVDAETKSDTKEDADDLEESAHVGLLSIILIVLF